ncbi:hypothetical protein O181_019877 [Austropuccinia psidii MF-1]|uniref:Uncharacterized protein n=1 Tax=Austropuccinia psidii MF-1 TaxID=1389203 RepID=A0A9Q3GUU7_9BASI|nr:hypothetical protein [Austropuccinia psidii MF-1]
MFSPEIVGDFNEEVVQKAPQHLPAPSLFQSQMNQPNNKETITSHLRSVAQNSRRHPQDYDSYGPQPPLKKLLRLRENMRNVNQVPDDEEEEEEEEEENHDCDESGEKGKEVEKENVSQNLSDSGEYK